MFNKSIEGKDLIDEIKQLLTTIKDKLQVEEMIDKTWKEGLHGIPRSVIGTPAYLQMSLGEVQPIEHEFVDLERNPDVTKLLVILGRVKDINEKIDVTGQEYNWRNARKFQTFDNPELLARIVDIKTECLIIKSNTLENESLVTNQSNGKQPSF